MDQLPDNARAIVAAHFGKLVEQVTADDMKTFEAQFPGALEKVQNMDADQSRLYAVPAGLQVVPNRGGGDCFFLALIQLLEPKRVIGQDLESTLDEFRRVTAEGLEPMLQTTGGNWSLFKQLLNKEDQIIIHNIEDAVQKAFETDQLSTEQREAIEMDWFKQVIREPVKVWGDNIYLLMFLLSPLNPYTQQTSLNILLIDRLAPAVLNKAQTPWASSTCFGSPYMFPGQKCFWGILIRTRLNDGRGAMHFEAATLPGVEPTKTRFQRMYDTQTMVNALAQLDYLQYVLDKADNSEIFRRCMAPFERRRP